MIKAMVTVFLLHWRLILLWVRSVEFENTWIFLGNEMSPELFQDFIEEHLE